MKSKKLPMFLKLAPFFVAAVTALLLVVFLGRSGNDVAEAHDGHPGLNFSIGVDTGGTSADDCSSFSGTTNCTVALSTEFRVRTYLNTLPTGVTSYEGFDVQLNYAGVDFMNRPSDVTNPSPDAGAAPTVGGNWPNCAIEANGSNASTVLAGCTIGIGAPASTYTGRITTTDFKCPAVNGFATVTLVHGISGSTALNENPSTKHSEGPGANTPGAPESLSITCGTPPTQTFTPSPTRTSTRTFTPTSTPSITPTPTVSPTSTNTPTATPLPSDQPDLTITKTDSPDPVAGGGIITYSLVVKNIGQQTATGITAADILPSQVVFVSANSSGATCTHDGSLTGGTVACPITGSLAQNAQVKIVIQVTAESPVADEHITNQALVLGNNEPFFNLGNNSEYEQTVVLAPRPDLVLTKTDLTDPIVSGAPEMYNLTVDNIGPEPAEDVVIKDNLPAGSVYNDALSSPECDAGSGPDPDVGTVDVVCDLGTVAGQKTVQIAITGPIVTRDSVIVNLAYVSSSNELFTQTGNNLDGEFTAVIAPDPDITVDKTGPVHVKRVQQFQYTLTITNIGLGDAFNVSVSDTLPMTSINSINQPMTLQSVVGATCSPVVSQIFTCNIPELDANGGQAVLTLNVRAPTTLVNIDLTNQASVSDPDEPGEPTGNNSDSAITQIRACFDVNGDNLMRIHDILTEVDHYFAEPPSPTYDLLYDFDGSGKVTINDILLAVQHYFDDVPCVK